MTIFVLVKDEVHEYWSHCGAWKHALLEGIIRASNPVTSMQPEVREKYKEKVMEYVRKAISLFDGNQLKNEKALEFDEIVYVLSNFISLPSMEHNRQEKRRFVSDALCTVRSYKRLTLYRFLKRIDTEHNAYSRKQKKKHFVVFTTNVAHGSLRHRKAFVILGTQIRACSFKYIQRNFQLKQALDDLKERSLLDDKTMADLKDRSLFLIDENAADETSAFSLAKRKEELLRSMFNFAETLMTVSFQFGKPASLSLVEPPRFTFVFNQHKKYKSFWYSQGEPEYGAVWIQEELLKHCQKLLRKFNSLRASELEQILIESLLRYNYAQDEYVGGLAFVYFWQILEFIALKNFFNITEKEVCNRIKTISSISGFGEVYRDIVDALYERRNQLIHQETISDYSIEDINLIRLVCQYSVGFLLKHANRLMTKERLDFFYRNYDVNKEDFTRRKQVLGIIKKIKKY